MYLDPEQYYETSATEQDWQARSIEGNAPIPETWGMHEMEDDEEELN